jgi:hypothetical protein
MEKYLESHPPMTMYEYIESRPPTTNRLSNPLAQRRLLTYVAFALDCDTPILEACYIIFLKTIPVSLRSVYIYAIQMAESRGYKGEHPVVPNSRDIEITRLKAKKQPSLQIFLRGNLPLQLTRHRSKPTRYDLYIYRAELEWKGDDSRNLFHATFRSPFEIVDLFFLPEELKARDISPKRSKKRGGK